MKALIINNAISEIFDTNRQEPLSVKPGLYNPGKLTNAEWKSKGFKVMDFDYPALNANQIGVNAAYVLETDSIVFTFVERVIDDLETAKRKKIEEGERVYNEFGILVSRCIARDIAANGSVSQELQSVLATISSVQDQTVAFINSKTTVEAVNGIYYKPEDIAAMKALLKPFLQPE